MRRISVAELPKNVPFLFASNHPNSFFDALVIATQLDQRMYFLTRGDVFRNPIHARILSAMNMIPIYRLREGRDDLQLTRTSFDRSQAIFENGDSVLIFAEGLSLNENGLRPLGKGTARIAHSAWYHDTTTPLIVVPTWLYYDTFKKPFMNVTLATGRLMGSVSETPITEAHFLRSFTFSLHTNLTELGDQVNEFVAPKKKQVLSVLSRSFCSMSLVPAMVLHAIWYFPLRWYIHNKTKGTVFFDSVFFGILFITYPLWLLLLMITAHLFGASWSEAFCLAGLAPISVLIHRAALSYYKA